MVDLVKKSLEKEGQALEIRVIVEAGRALPSYASTGAAGADVCAKLESALVIPPRKSALVPTGLFFEIPPGFEIQVRPRSGLALKHQITVLNTPGTIDSDYRGELKVILINHGESDFIVEPNMRVAQIVVASVCQATFLPSSVISKKWWKDLTLQKV